MSSGAAAQVYAQNMAAAQAAALRPGGSAAAAAAAATMAQPSLATYTAAQFTDPYLNAALTPIAGYVSPYK